MTMGEPAGMTMGEPAGMTMGEPAGMTMGEPAGMTMGEPAGVSVFKVKHFLCGCLIVFYPGRGPLCHGIELQ